MPLELTVQVLINALIATPSQVSNVNFKYYNRNLKIRLNAYFKFNFRAT